MSARPPLSQALRADIDPATMQHLHTELSDRARTEGLLDVAYTVVDSPIGELLLAATPAGLVRVAFASEDHDAVLTELARRVSPRILHAPEQMAPFADQVSEYFTGRRREFRVAVDLSLVSGFRQEVLTELQRVGFGERVSYTELAARSGRPLAVRAAAGACAHNPVPVVVPCHRVLRSDGSLGGYRGGLPAKETLLALESAA